ncbi:hypothetical protein KFK09_025242 [Dendrobium nobile]|uniref:Uncharacterized protein n=1 Tax=Dendrobium nobile TaxID=94219 RepID=A0A8T3ALI4_DENNO|nr:hypothetical protein KFK09_025242 [Dendrobium nobile]
MSIAMESGAGIGGSGFARRIACVAIFDAAEMEERKRMDHSPSPPVETTVASSTSTSSSIGKDSDEVGSQEDEEEGEVQSAHKGPLLGTESLEESLPVRRSISNFYTGKSKSFTSLSDVAASCDSAKDLAKEENSCTRKRRNLLALKIMLERPQNTLKSSGGGITKKLTAPTRSTLAIAAAMSGSPRHSNGGENVNDLQQNALPPLPRLGKSVATIASEVVLSSPQQYSFPLRSFSLGDLSGMANLGSTIETGNVENNFE